MCGLAVGHVSLCCSILVVVLLGVCVTVEGRKNGETARR